MKKQWKSVPKAMPSLPMFKEGLGLDAERWDEMVHMALAHDWKAYGKRCEELGCLSPRREPDSVESFDPSKGMGSFNADDYDVLGYAAHTAEDPVGVLESLRKACAPEDFNEILEGLLRACPSQALTRAWNDEAPSILMRAGAKNTEFCAGQLAQMGQFEALRAMLDAGLEADSIDDGGMPLILSALSKERIYVMSEKMRTARLLYERGARLQGVFASENGVEEPRSLLELGLLCLIHDMGGPIRKMKYAEFSFPWGYFEESGIPISEVLPDASNRMGNERVGLAMKRVEKFIERRVVRLSVAKKKKGKPASSRPSEGLPEYVKSAWLDSAFDLADMRASVGESVLERAKRGSL